MNIYIYIKHIKRSLSPASPKPIYKNPWMGFTQKVTRRCRRARSRLFFVRPWSPLNRQCSIDKLSKIFWKSESALDFFGVPIKKGLKAGKGVIDW